MLVKKQKYLFLILLIIIGAISNAIVIYAKNCSKNSDCYPGYCSLGTCINTCGDDNCQSSYGETSSNCCLDCGCPSGETCTLTSGSYSCVASFSANRVCEYDKGERIGNSFVDGVDDCDQDGDGYYDHCEEEVSCKGIVDKKNSDFPDFCPGTKEGVPVSDDSLRTSGCSCDQVKEENLCGGVSINCLEYKRTFSFDDDCLKRTMINVICSEEHPSCYTDNEISSIAQDYCLKSDNINVGNSCETKGGEEGTCNDEGKCIVKELIKCSFNCSELNTEDSCVYYEGVNITYESDKEDCSVNVDLKEEKCQNYLVNKSEGTICPGGYCDGEGNCVECLSNNNCTESFICKDNNCVCPENKVEKDNKCVYESCSSDYGLFCINNYKEPEISNIKL